jgi:hypothetical protein
VAAGFPWEFAVVVVSKAVRWEFCVVDGVREDDGVSGRKASRRLGSKRFKRFAENKFRMTLPDRVSSRRKAGPIPWAGFSTRCTTRNGPS